MSITPGFEQLSKTVKKVRTTSAKNKSVYSSLNKQDVCQYMEIYQLNSDKSFHLTTCYRQASHHPDKTIEIGSHDLWFREYKESLKALLYNCNFVILLNTLCKISRTPNEKITLEILDKCLSNLDKLNLKYEKVALTSDTKNDIISLYLSALSNVKNRYSYNKEIATCTNHITHKRDVELGDGNLNTVAINLLKQSKGICIDLFKNIDIEQLKIDRTAQGKNADSVENELNESKKKETFYFEQVDKWIEKLEQGKTDLNELCFIFSSQNTTLNV